MTNTIFGINGSATFSRMRIERDGERLATFQSGGSSLYVDSIYTVQKNLVHLFEQAKEHLGIDLNGYDAGCIGNGGIDREHTTKARELRSIFTRLGIGVRDEEKLMVCNDGDILFVGAFKDVSAVGSVMVSGTGSIVIARTASGDIVRFGGYGHVLGDEGSAHWIAIQIFTRILQAYEEQHISPLGEAVVEHMRNETEGEYSDIPDIVSYVSSLRRRPEVAQYSAFLTKKMIESDPIAKDIALLAAEKLYKLFDKTRRLFPESAHSLVLGGKVLFYNEFIRNHVIERCGKDVKIMVFPENETPEKGACLLARELLS